MRKITLIASALLVASTLFASPALKADKLTASGNKTIEAVALTELKAAFPLQAKKAKAPAATTAISNVVVGAQTGHGDAPFTWQTEGQSLYFLFTVYAANMQKVLQAGYYGAAQFAVSGATNTYQWNLANLVYNATDHQLSALPAGKWYVSVTGYNAENGSAVLSEAESISAEFEIVSYDVTGFAATLNAEKTTLTINFDVLTLPANHFYGIQIAQADNVILNNYTTQTLPALPYTFTVSEGNSYSIRILPLEIYNGKFYIACDNYIDTIITVGTNKLTPTNLSTTVVGDTVLMQWSAEETAEYYWVDIYDSYGDFVNLTTAYTDKQYYAVILPPDEYTWSVTAMKLSGTTLYEASEPVYGEEFYTEDIVAPEVTDVVVSGITDHSAKVSFKVTDKYTAAADMQVAIYTDGYLEVAYPELQEDGTFAAEITMVPGEADMEPLKPNTTYNFTISVFDSSWNMARVPFSITTLAEGETALENLAAAGITYKDGVILNADGVQLRVYNAAGMLVAEGAHNIDMNGFAAGAYLVRTQQATLKIVK